MVVVKIRKGRKSDSKGILSLVDALAAFEHLDPPSEEGKKRLLADIFSSGRVSLFVAEDGGRLVGYALYFFTYSSFLAKPTLYLEDLFVLDRERGRGTGFALFRRCVEESVAKGCGRMEWSVLTWNTGAIEFYERLGAKRMDEWYVYRLDEQALKRVPRKQ